MTISPFQINDAAGIYNRVLRLKPSDIIVERDQSEPQDIVDISAEGKKRQVLDQAKGEVLDRIRGAK